MGQAGETLTRESPGSLSKTHHSAQAQLDKLKEESRSLNQLKRAHERLQGHQAQVSKANAELESLNTNKNTRSKLQQADVGIQCDCHPPYCHNDLYYQSVVQQNL